MAVVLSVLTGITITCFIPSSAVEYPVLYCQVSPDNALRQENPGTFPLDREREFYENRPSELLSDGPNYYGPRGARGQGESNRGGQRLRKRDGSCGAAGAPGYGGGPRGGGRGRGRR
jgi:hypothetical protein